MQMKRVYIRWYDAYGLDNWQLFEDAKKLTSSKYLVQTIAYLFHETEDCYVICHSFTSVQVCGLMNIPKCSVEKIKILKNEDTH